MQILFMLMMRRNRSISANLDHWLVLLYILLVVIGWLNIFAANYSEDFPLISFNLVSGKQLLWIISAFVLAWLCIMIEANFIKQLSNFIFTLSILLLLAVLVFGSVVKGARSWFSFGDFFRLQPSEFAKIATSLALANLLSSYESRLINTRTRFKAFVIILLPAVLIAIQPDFGSAIVFMAFIFVLYREGLSGKILIGVLACIVLFIVTVMMKDTSINFPFDLQLSGPIMLVIILFIISTIVYFLLKKFKRVLIYITAFVVLSSGYVLSVDYAFDHALKVHQRNRILELVGRKYDPKGTGYNVNQSKIAIGSGGFMGKGFLQGTQTKFDFVPEQSTDFIFCTVGEEWGFVGSFTVIILFTVMLFRLIIVAERQRSKFSRIYGYCFASLLFFHVAVNIGMTIGFAPVIGIPLPFFSYGGSSLWAFTIMLFLFIRMDAERMRILK